ncbi:unnamed protein product [Chironomus riparius]|uniref:BHLH domain-containing protein n=1 Tax=Chironomus riparius TaxID=315576 RepID=A0A9N9RTL2_9DIPT|nr:unnamed protein product [Chironomus riparius]
MKQHSYIVGSDVNVNFYKKSSEMEKYEVDGNCLIIFGNCHDINSNSSSNNGTDNNYDPFGNEMEMTTKQRNQANARERFRTHRFIESFSSLTTKKLNQELKNFSHHSVNSAFNTLRLLIPTEPKNRKLSKIETLRLAKSYISHLNATLATGNTSCRQPCFGASSLHKQQKHQHQEQHDYRSNICTFCVSSVIHQKRIN